MARKKNPLKENIEREAVALVTNAVTQYKDANFFVTERVWFEMRTLVKRLRKNYWGVYDYPIDPITGKQKFWAPYTQLVVNSIMRSRDMDSKDARFRGTSRTGLVVAKQLRGWFRDWAHYNNFGELVNDTNLGLGIDGTQVWKTVTYRKNGKTHVKVIPVDILNCYLDPTSPSIQEAPSFTERALMTPQEIKQMDWMNKDVKPSASLHRSDSDLIHSFQNQYYVDVYEYWADIPEYLITGQAADTDMVPGRIVVSGIDSAKPKLHKIERNTNKDKDGNSVRPYEEVRFIKVPGRWYGLGPAEMVLYIQEYINQILNNRLKKNTASVLGLFKVKNNSGINQKVLSGLMSQGVIKVNGIDDITNFPIEEAGPGSYKDEEMMKQWGYEITANQDIARGAQTAISTSATASAIQNSNAQSGASLDMEKMGLFWQRWFNRHVLPHAGRMIYEQGFARLYADFEDIAADRERVVSYLAVQNLEEMYKAGIVPTEQEVAQAMTDALRQLQQEGDLLVEVGEKLITDGCEAYFHATDEEIDAQLTVSNLIQMMQIIPDAQREMAAEAMDLMGLNIPASLLNAVPVRQGTPEQPQTMNGIEQLTAATTSMNGPDLTAQRA